MNRIHSRHLPPAGSERDNVPDDPDGVDGLILQQRVPQELVNGNEGKNEV
jgi:hypothetical protein